MKKHLGVILGGTFLFLAVSEGAFIFINRLAIQKELKLGKRYKNYYNLLSQWITNKNRSVSIAERLKSNGYNNIGVYGMGTIAATFMDELQNSGISIKFISDKDYYNFYEADIPIISIEQIRDYYDNIDAIIITPIGDYEEILNSLKKAGVEGKAVSIADLVYEK